MTDKLKGKKEIMDILPSLEDAKLFYNSTKESAALQMKELEDAIKEKYRNKIRTNISFEVINENTFRCALSLGYEQFSHHWFHFISYEKKLDENFPVELYAFSNKLYFGTAMDMNDLENILVTIIKHEKTEILILSNI